MQIFHVFESFPKLYSVYLFHDDRNFLEPCRSKVWCLNPKVDIRQNYSPTSCQHIIVVTFSEIITGFFYILTLFYRSMLQRVSDLRWENCWDYHFSFSFHISMDNGRSILKNGLLTFFWWVRNNHETSLP